MIWIVDAFRNGWRLIRNLLARLPGPRVDYVVVDLAGSFPERTPPPQPFWRRMVVRPWQRQEESLEALRARLERIAGAPGVRGIVLRVRDLHVRMATVQSLRSAIGELRRRGKRVIAYLPEANLATYYLATAADEIVMAAAGFWNVTGLRTEITFFRSALDRIGILPEFDRIAEYKTAADPLMRPGLSEHHREVIESILDGLVGEVTTDVASARRLDPAAVRAAIDRAPMTADEARAAGLIDGISYEDELPARLGSPDRPAGLHPWAHASRRLPVSYRWRARTAVIGVVELIGNIITGESREMPVPLPVIGGRFAGSDTVARAFRAAERHPGVRAVVFHVESGGGSALASDLIWREVDRVRRKKPVVVFMGNVAGSGGYYVACGANCIVAQPNTITGSIGVLNGKLTARGLYERLGLNREIVARGGASTLESMFQPYTPDQLARVQHENQMIYRRFIGTVAAGRSKAESEVDAIARGRVWTGRQALERGLIDELGDFTLAMRRACELAGIASAQAVTALTIQPPRAAGIPSAAGAMVEALETLGAIGALAGERALLMTSVPGGVTWD